MAKDPAFPFYAQDYLVDTLRWDRGMKSLHIDLLCESWANGIQALTDEGGYIKFLSAEDRKIWEKIRYKWASVDGFWINSKLEETRTARKTYKKIQSDKGKLSAEKRKNTLIVVEQRLNNGSTLEREKENEKEIIKDLKGEKDFLIKEFKEEAQEVEIYPTFEDFWNEYDKKVGDKEKIKPKWKRLTQAEREAIMEHIPNYKLSEPNKKFRKNPEAYLNNKTWNDEIIIDNGKKQTNTANFTDKVKSSFDTVSRMYNQGG